MKQRKTCIKCGKDRPVEQFKLYDGVHRKNVCWTCQKATTAARNKSLPPREQKCVFCGATFTAFPASDGRYRRTCSKDCANDLRRKTPRPYNPVKYQTYSPSFDLPLHMQGAEMCPLM